MRHCSIPFSYLIGYALLAAFFSSCSIPAYSPGLGLGVNNTPHRHTRLGVSLERVPNGFSARESWPRTSRAIGWRYERGLSDNVALRAKAFFAQNVSRNEPGYNGVGFGVGVESVVNRPLSNKTDLVLVPRLQFVSAGIISGGSGYGGGATAVIRHRLKPDLAVYGGPAAYFGSAENTISQGTTSTDSFTPGGLGLGGHLGLSYNVASLSNFNLEVTPLRVSDNFHNRSVWVPVVQLAFSREIIGRSREERRRRRAQRKAAKALRKNQ